MLIKAFQKGVRLWRAFRGRCPYCGKNLVFEKRSADVRMFYKVCPDGHFGVENHGDGRVTYHDNSGDPVALFHDHRMRYLKGGKSVNDSTITTKIIHPVEDEEATETLDKEPDDEDFF